MSRRTRASNGGMTALSQALEARGELKGKRQALQAFLETRFGVLPKPVLQRIDRANAPQLDALLRRAATIESIDAL